MSLAVRTIYRRLRSSREEPAPARGRRSTSTAPSPARSRRSRQRPGPGPACRSPAGRLRRACRVDGDVLPRRSPAATARLQPAHAGRFVSPRRGPSGPGRRAPPSPGSPRPARLGPGGRAPPGAVPAGRRRRALRQVRAPGRVARPARSLIRWRRASRRLWPTGTRSREARPARRRRSGRHTGWRGSAAAWPPALGGMAAAQSSGAARRTRPTGGATAQPRCRPLAGPPRRGLRRGSPRPRARPGQAVVWSGAAAAPAAGRPAGGGAGWSPRRVEGSSSAARRRSGRSLPALVCLLERPGRRRRVGRPARATARPGAPPRSVLGPHSAVQLPNNAGSPVPPPGSARPSPRRRSSPAGSQPPDPVPRSPPGRRSRPSRAIGPAPCASPAVNPELARPRSSSGSVPGVPPAPYCGRGTPPTGSRSPLSRPQPGGSPGPALHRRRAATSPLGRRHGARRVRGGARVRLVAPAGPAPPGRPSPPVDAARRHVPGPGAGCRPPPGRPPGHRRSRLRMVEGGASRGRGGWGGGCGGWGAAAEGARPVSSSSRRLGAGLPLRSASRRCCRARSGPAAPLGPLAALSPPGHRYAATLPVLVEVKLRSPNTISR